MNLEAAHAEERSGRCADFRGVIGEGAQVVSEESRRTGELHASQLHAVAGVSGEPDRYVVKVL